jgi:hypothetical protein
MVSRGPVGVFLVRNISLDFRWLKVVNDKHLYHFVDLKPIHPSTRKKRDVVQEEFIQRNELVRIFNKKKKSIKYLIDW